MTAHCFDPIMFPPLTPPFTTESIPVSPVDTDDRRRTRCGDGAAGPPPGGIIRVTQRFNLWTEEPAGESLCSRLAAFSSFAASSEGRGGGRKRFVPLGRFFRWLCWPAVSVRWRSNPFPFFMFTLTAQRVTSKVDRSKCVCLSAGEQASSVPVCQLEKLPEFNREESQDSTSSSSLFPRDFLGSRGERNKGTCAESEVWDDVIRHKFNWWQKEWQQKKASDSKHKRYGARTEVSVDRKQELSCWWTNLTRLWKTMYIQSDKHL